MFGQADDPIDVLLVEDDPGDALMVREHFDRAGRNGCFHVIPDGRQALSSRPRVTPHQERFLGQLTPSARPRRGCRQFG